MFIDNQHFMFEYENKLWNDGYKNIVGIDEVGRGPIAGPVVAAAVIIPRGVDFPAVDDSKKLTARQREKLQKMVFDVPGIEYAIAEIQVEEIDRLNILRASQLAMKNTIALLNGIDIALIDGLAVPNFPVDSINIVKGDSKSASIASASILAKVHRDEIMNKYAEDFPEYGFDRHKGYCTAYHLKALKKFGPCPIHRKSFVPVKEFFEKKELIQLEFEF